MITTGSVIRSSLSSTGRQTTETSGYRTVPLAITFMSLPNGRHADPRSASRSAKARFMAIVTWAADPPVIIVTTPLANSYRSDCSRSQARNSSTDISFSATFGMRNILRRNGALVQIHRLRQRAERPRDRGDALDDGRARQGHLALLEGDDGQPGEGFEELAGAQQEFGVARTAEARVAGRAGFVNQDAPGRQRR